VVVARKYSYLSHIRDSPPPPPPHLKNNPLEIPKYASYISLNFWSYRFPHPQEISIPSVGGVWIFLWKCIFNCGMLTSQSFIFDKRD